MCGEFKDIEDVILLVAKSGKSSVTICIEQGNVRLLPIIDHLINRGFNVNKNVVSDDVNIKVSW